MADLDIRIDKQDLQRLTKRLHAMSMASDPKDNTPITKALKASALRIETNIKKSPEMPVLTGRLRSSIHSKFANSEVYTYVDMRGTLFDGSLKEVIKPNQDVVVRTNVDYAIKQNVIHHFMRDGFTKTLPEIKRFFENAEKMIVSGKGGAI